MTTRKPIRKFLFQGLHLNNTIRNNGGMISHISNADILMTKKQIIHSSIFQIDNKYIIFPTHSNSVYVIDYDERIEQIRNHPISFEESVKNNNIDTIYHSV